MISRGFIKVATHFSELIGFLGCEDYIYPYYYGQDYMTHYYSCLSKSSCVRILVL